MNKYVTNIPIDQDKMRDLLTHVEEIINYEGSICKYLMYIYTLFALIIIRIVM
jgi:hypothetical protein